MNNNAMTVPLYTAELLRVTLGPLCERLAAEQHPMAECAQKALAEYETAVAEYVCDFYGSDGLDRAHDITMLAAERVGVFAVGELGNTL